MVDAVPNADTPTGAAPPSTPIGGGDFLPDRAPMLSFTDTGPAKSKAEATMDFMKYSVPGVVTGLLDTFGSSLHITNKDAVGGVLTSVWPEAGDYYQRNKEALQTVGDLTGMFLPGLGGMKLVQSTSRIAEAVGEAGYAGKILGSILHSGQEADALLSTVSSRALYYGAQGQTNFAFGAIPELDALRRGVTATKVGDSIKEMIGFEAATFATMNSSETLYPPDQGLSGYLALNAVGIAVPALAEGMVMKRAVNRIYANTAKASEEVLNPTGLNYSDLQFRPGDRDLGVTATAFQRNALSVTMDQTTGDDILLRDNLNKNIIEQDKILKKQLGAMGTDNLFKQYPSQALTTSYELKEGDLATAMSAIKDDPTAFAGTVSIDAVPSSQKGLLAWQEKQAKYVDNLEKDALTKITDAATEADADKALTLNKQASQINLTKQDVDALQQFVYTPAGEQIPAMMYKPRFSDGNYGLDIAIKKGNANDPTTWYVQGITDDYFKGQAGVGVTADGFVLMPKIAADTTITTTTTTTKATGGITGPITLKVPVMMEGGTQQVQVMRTNVKQIIPASALQADEHQAELLRNLGDVFHWQDGQLGKPIYQSLTPESKNVVQQWTSNSNSVRRLLEDTSSKEFQEIYNAYAPMRRQLLQLKAAGDDGTIGLWRGESKAETANPTHDVVSMSTDYNVAKQFAKGNGNITKVYVPVDDIVMSAGFGKANGKEFEFVVKGNLNRRVGKVETVPAGSKQTQHIPVTISVEELNKMLPQQQQQTITQITKSIADSAPVSNYDSLGYKERSAAFSLMQKAAEAYNPAKASKMSFAPGDHWTRLEFAKELATRHGDDFFAKAQFPQVWGTGQVLQSNIDFNIMAGKYTSYRLLNDMQAQSKAGFIKLAESQELNAYDYQYLLNLRSGPHGELSPALDVFHQMYSQGTIDLKQDLKGIEHFNRIAQEAKNMDAGGVGAFQAKASMDYTGNNLHLPGGNNPLLVTKKPVTLEDYMGDQLATQLAGKRATTLAYLMSAKQQGAQLVGIVTDAIQGTSAYQEARKTSNLIEGSLPGKQQLNQGNWNARGNFTLQAAEEVASVSDRQIEKWIGDQYRPFNPIFSQLRGANNIGDLTSFNMFEQSRRFGWDLTGEAATIDRNGQNFHGFPMQDTSYNRKKWGQLFGKDNPFPEDETMRMMPAIAGDQFGKPLYISDLARQGVEAFKSLGDQALINTNHMRRTLGLGDIRRKDYWMPPRNLARENVSYLIFPDQTKTVISGRTPAEVKSLVEKELENLPAELKGKVIVSDAKTMQAHFNLGDEPFFNLQNFSDPLLQTGRAQGATARRTLETGTGVLDDMVTVLNRQYQSIGRRSRALNFEAEIQHAKIMHDASGYVGHNNSIWQTYTNTIYGIGAQSSGVIGIELNGTEATYNMVASALFDRARSYGLKGLGLLENAQAALRNTDKEYQKIKSQLGEFAPFKESTDFAEKTFNIAFPPTMRQHMGALNNFTTTLTLRFADVANALVNGFSLISNMPPIVRALNRMEGEDVTAWGNRISHYGTPIGADIGTFNPTRVLTSTVHDFFNNTEFKAAMDRASKAGFFKQEVAEFNRSVLAPQAGLIKSFINKGVGYASLLSDKSEEWARMYAFGAGYKIGKDILGMTNEKDLFMFASKRADEAIGNYRSQNKPQIFSGAAGMPFGLFQTFAWNYMHRMFSYVENKQYRALATQYGMQALVFGGQSVPGMYQFTHYVATSNDGINNPIDGLRNRFGDAMADMVLYGPLSVMTHSSINTRGDANIQRIPGFWAPDETPIANLASNTYKILSGVVDQFRQSGHLSQQATAELLGTYAMNRPFRHIMEMAANASVDQSGELITNDVRNGISIASRLAGLTPLTEQKQKEAIGRVTATRKSQEYVEEKLRASARPMMRGGEMDGEVLGDWLRTYAKHGGNPAGFGRWVRDQFLSATLDKTQRGLLDSAHNPLHYADTLRYLHAQSDNGGEQ